MPEEDRKLAAHYRIDEGEHVIPAPVGQLRRDFAGYFMNPLKQFRDRAMGTSLDHGREDKRKADEGSGERTEEDMTDQEKLSARRKI